MKNLIALLVIILNASLAYSIDWKYKSLEKLYHKDKRKCLEKAKFIMEHFPETTSSYFFASRVQMERAKSPRNLIAGFHGINSSMSYARQFESRTNLDIRDEVSWDIIVSDISTTAFNLSEELREAGYLKESKILAIQRKKLSPNNNVIEFTDYATVMIETEEEEEDENSHFDTDFSSELDKMEELENVEVVESNEMEVSNKNFTASNNVMALENKKINLKGLPKGTEFIIPFNYQNERAVLDLINLERMRLGLDTLEWNNDLANAARYHALDQASEDYFDHNSYDRINGRKVKVGSTFDRIKKFYDDSFVNSENIAAGNAKSKDTYQQWYNSKGHYDNMFNPNSKKAGIGVMYIPNSTFKYYWVFCSAE